MAYQMMNYETLLVDFDHRAMVRMNRLECVNAPFCTVSKPLTVTKSLF